MKKQGITRIAVFGILFSLSAFAMDENQIRAEIKNQSSQRHPNIPQGFWERLGVESVPVLIKMYRETTNGNEQAILIEGLSHFEDSAASAFLRSEIQSTEDEVNKKKMLSALIQSEGETAFDFVEPYLKDSDGHIRLAVARGLKNYSQNEKIARRLAEFRSQEKSAWVITDYEKSRSVGEGLQKPRKLIEKEPNKIAAQSEIAASASKGFAPLPEKSWAGLWRGSYLAEGKMLLVDATLIPVEGNSHPIKWRAELKIPKMRKQEWKSGEFALQYFQTAHTHWLEIRNSKNDIVIIVQRKAQ